MNYTQQPRTYAQQPQSYVPRPQSKTKKYVLIGVLVVVMIVILKHYQNSKLINGVNGGVTALKNNAAAKSLKDSIGVLAGSPHPSVISVRPKTAVVRIERILHGVVKPIDNNNFSIGEIKVYTDSKQLTKDDYAKAEYNMDGPNTRRFPAWNAVDGDPATFTHTSGTKSHQQVNLTLKKPAVVTAVKVLNRQSCCQFRLANSFVRLIDANGGIITSFQLSTQKDWQSFNAIF